MEDTIYAFKSVIAAVLKNSNKESVIEALTVRDYFNAPVRAPAVTRHNGALSELGRKVVYTCGKAWLTGRYKSSQYIGAHAFELYQRLVNDKKITLYVLPFLRKLLITGAARLYIQDYADAFFALIGAYYKRHAKSDRRAIYAILEPLFECLNVVNFASFMCQQNYVQFDLVGDHITNAAPRFVSAFKDAVQKVQNIYQNKRAEFVAYGELHIDADAGFAPGASHERHWRQKVRFCDFEVEAVGYGKKKHVKMLAAAECFEMV